MARIMATQTPGLGTPLKRKPLLLGGDPAGLEMPGRTRPKEGPFTPAELQRSADLANILGKLPGIGTVFNIGNFLSRLPGGRLHTLQKAGPTVLSPSLSPVGQAGGVGTGFGVSVGKAATRKSKPGHPMDPGGGASAGTK